MSTNLEDLILRDTYANIPAAGISGRLFYATDKGIIYRDNGTSWDIYTTDINGLTADATPDSAADYVMTYDNSASGLKKVLLDNLPGSEGGAPTTAKYITAASDAGLSAEIAIPGFAAHADAPDNFPSLATAYEFDTTDTVVTWTPSDPAVVDSNTTIKSHLYMKYTDNTERLGFVAWSPAGAFDARAKITIGAEYEGTSFSCGFMIADSTNSNRVTCQLLFIQGNPTVCVVQAYNYDGSYHQLGTNHNLGANEVYFRITRDGSNNITYYWSSNGLIWQRIVTHTFSITVAKIGFRLSGSDNTKTYYAACDWIRANV